MVNDTSNGGFSGGDKKACLSHGELTRPGFAKYCLIGDSGKFSLWVNPLLSKTSCHFSWFESKSKQICEVGSYLGNKYAKRDKVVMICPDAKRPIMPPCTPACIQHDRDTGSKSRKTFGGGRNHQTDVEQTNTTVPYERSPLEKSPNWKAAL